MPGEFQHDVFQFQYDVFLSHSAKDKPAARELAQRLKKSGLRVWFDEWEIRPGDMIALKIQHGVEKSRTLLLCMSPDYFESEWAALEHHTLLFRDPTNAQRRFIPLLIKDCTPPGIIAQFAYMDWRSPSDKAYEKLLTACLREEATAEESPTSKETEKEKPSAREEKPPARKEKSGQARMVLREHTLPLTSVAVTPDGKTVVSGSGDQTLKTWNLRTGNCRATFESHTGFVHSVAVTPDGKMVVSGSDDKTLKVWDLETGNCRATFEGHTSWVYGVAITPDSKTVVSGSDDKTLKAWDLETGQCRVTFGGHRRPVHGVAVTPDGKTVVSGSNDKTLKVWDLATGHCRATFEGHTDYIWGVAVTPDGKTVISGSWDKTLKVWDLETGQCRATFEGHTYEINSVAVTSDGKTVVSGSGGGNGRLKVWDLETGQCRATFEGHTNSVQGVAITPDGKTVVSASFDDTLRVWDLPEPEVAAKAAARYTNAKVVLVGETGVGKTGLALRLCEDRWEATESTHGMIVSQLALPPGAGPAGLEREVWLWDFAGQPDYRLIHQLYMDETALGVLVFDPQDDNPFENIGYWEKALSAAARRQPAKLLVAARSDRGGITISRKRFEQYVRERNFAGFLSTGAKSGEGCEELKAAIARHIPWNRLPWTATSRLFKTLKDAILKLAEEDAPLARLPELRQRLQLSLPEETINEESLRAVVGLMQGQGVVQTLAFGDFVLLQPEWINRYASVVVRMAREHADEMGVVPEQQVLDGRLDYKDVKRLAEADEKILLRAMVQTFLDHSLCIRQETPRGTMLVFPSYFRRDKPDLPEHPNVFVTYGFAGPLDEIYATLVVRLNYSDEFKTDQLWKDAADFKTPGGKRVGLAMTKKAEGAAEIVVYFEAGVPDDTKVTFIKYIHEHLLARAQPREDVTRVRTYVCPHCDEPLENRRAIQARLAKGLKDIICPTCEKRTPLLDLIEEKFASDEFLRRVREMDERASINLDNESRGLILVGHAIAIAAEAGQIFRPVVWGDWGIDGEIEFKDYEGRASGQRVYLQLKSGDSYLYRRRRDDAEVFTIKNPRHADYWQKQKYPVMLVIRTSDGKIRWMDVTGYLKRERLGGKKVDLKRESPGGEKVDLKRESPGGEKVDLKRESQGGEKVDLKRESPGGKKEVKQIVFDGEPFTALNLQRMREKLIPPPVK